jgi:hypothetical protein
MKEILFFKGKYEIITLREFSGMAKQFYEPLYELFKSAGYTYKTIETISEEKAGDHISEQTMYIFGHSKGATRILKEFVARDHPGVKGVVIFDPKQTCKKQWNELRIPKLLFVSIKEQTQNYSGFQDRIELNDNHYFSNSKNQVFPVLKKFIL